MRGRAIRHFVWFTALALMVGACGGPAPSASPSGTASPVGIMSPPVPTPSGSAEPSAWCAGRTWPPYHMGTIPGITITSPHAGTLEISNHTDRTYYYSVPRWEMEQYVMCVGLGELNIGNGPVDSGETARVMFFGNPAQGAVRLTVAFWDKPCGEGCQREPVVAMPVTLSPVAPIGT